MRDQKSSVPEREQPRTQYDTGPGCKVCDRRILWREGQGWLHARSDTGPLVLYPHEDPYGHEAEGGWSD